MSLLTTSDEPDRDASRRLAAPDEVSANYRIVQLAQATLALVDERMQIRGVLQSAQAHHVRFVQRP